MNAGVKKGAILTFVAVVVATAGAAFVLNRIRPEATVDVAVSCERINFDVAGAQGDGRPVSLLSSGLWAESVAVTEWESMALRIAPGPLPDAFSWLGDTRDIVVVPASPNARVEVTSAPEFFSVCDAFVARGSRISWWLDEDSHRMTLAPAGAAPGDVALVLCAGDGVDLSLLDCAIEDSDGRTVHETPPGRSERMSLPTSFVNREVVVASSASAVEVTVIPQPDALAEPVTLIRDLAVSNVDYSWPERTAEGGSRTRNAVLEGTVRRRSGDSDVAFELGALDQVAAVPPSCRLTTLSADVKELGAALVYDVSSLQIGPPGARREVVPSLLDLALGNRTVLLIYTVSVTVFGFITKHFLAKKEGE